MLGAPGLSLPRGERPRPATVKPGSTAFSASYAAASTLPKAAALACPPRGWNCGRQKRGWFGSFPTTKRRTCGYVRATSAAHSANAAGAAASVVKTVGRAPYRASTIRTPAASARASAASRTSRSGIAAGSDGSHFNAITFVRRPSAAIAS